MCSKIEKDEMPMVKNYPLPFFTKLDVKVSFETLWYEFI